MKKVKDLVLDKNLFDLTESDVNKSKMFYNNTIIKCLVAPYHTYNDIEKVLEYSKNTFVFPEREMNINQIKELISLISMNPNIKEARIVTKNQNIIMDMIDSSVKILTEYNEIVKCPSKTLYANIHNIRYDILENNAHRLPVSNESEKTYGNKQINTLIDELKELEGKTISEEKYNELKNTINIIGEKLIRINLLEMLNSIKVTKTSNVKSSKYNSLSEIVNRIEELEKNSDNLNKEEMNDEIDYLMNELENMK